MLTPGVLTTATTDTFVAITMEASTVSTAAIQVDKMTRAYKLSAIYLYI